MNGELALNTNESRTMHDSRITFGRLLDHDRRRCRSGWVYACPRCSFASRTMKHPHGARLVADRHTLECPCDGSSSDAALASRLF